MKKHMKAVEDTWGWFEVNYGWVVEWGFKKEAHWSDDPAPHQAWFQDEKDAKKWLDSLQCAL